MSVMFDHGGHRFGAGVSFIRRGLKEFCYSISQHTVTHSKLLHEQLKLHSDQSPISLFVRLALVEHSQRLIMCLVTFIHLQYFFLQSSNTKREDQPKQPAQDPIVVIPKHAVAAKQHTLQYTHPCHNDHQRAASSCLWDHDLALDGRYPDRNHTKSGQRLPRQDACPHRLSR